MAISCQGYIAITTDLGEILIFDKIDTLNSNIQSREPILLYKFEKVNPKIFFYCIFYKQIMDYYDFFKNMILEKNFKNYLN